MDKVEEYIKRLEDEEWNVRSDAARALGNLVDSRAVGPLIKALGDEVAYVRRYAAKALGQLGEPSAVEPLIKALGDREKRVRSDAARALGNLSDPRAVEPLIKVIGDREKRVRRHTAWALGKLGDLRAVAPLIKALGDEDGDVRKEAAKTLEKLGDNPRAVEPLNKALGDEDWMIRESAAYALARLPDMRVVPALGKYYEKHFEKEKAEKLLREVIDRLAPLQRENIQHLPRLLCITCYRRPIVKKMKIGPLSSLKYAVCPQCGTSALARDIREVVGVVDGRTGHEIHDDTLYVRLWDNTAQECVYADIDRLEIREADGLRYDIIVNKLILTLHDRSGRGQDYLPGIPVQLLGNPDIPLGTRSLLEQQFREVTEKQ